MSLVKLPLIAISTLTYHVSSTPPHQPANTEIVRQTPYERLLSFTTRYTTRVFKTIYWFGAATEMASILARNIDPGLIPGALEGTVKALTTLKDAPITPTFLFGSVLATLGGLLRWQCFRTLGRHFTFILSLRKDHHLVTSGPYAYVRHPSYTGLTMVVLGILIMHGSKDSFLRSSGILLTVPGGRLLALGWMVGMIVVNVGMFRRMRREDRMLKDAFGEEWERWAKRVRYRLIPGVY
ncbi:hypothetical protein F5I97DRAFT_820831 [Phlebopus sp. FC_14]|nr:hypothetical protein F5I97DRAFT_820831 [Phlebopus sp. FC_14]